MKLPQFTVEFEPAWTRGSIDWIAKDRRYHIWIGLDGKPVDDLIHSNSLNAKIGEDTYRHGSQKAKRWAPMIAAMVEEVISHNLVDRAIADAQRLQDEEAARDAAQLREERLGRFTRAIRCLPEDVRNTLAALHDDDKEKFIALLETP